MRNYRIEFVRTAEEDTYLDDECMYVNENDVVDLVAAFAEYNEFYMAIITEMHAPYEKSDRVLRTLINGNDIDVDEIENFCCRY